MATKKKIKKRQKRKPKVTVEGVYSEAIGLSSEMFRVGESDLEVAEKIKERFPILSDANVQFVIHKGSQLVASQFKRDAKSIVSLHVKRYNEEIKNLMAKSYEGLVDEDTDDEEGGDAAKWRRKMRIYTLGLVMDVMLQKEKVLQLHGKSTQVKIFNKLNVKVKEKKVMFNLEPLSLVEKIEFLDLINRAKKNQNELFSVIASGNQQEVIEDISHEVVENNNIKEIKLINAPEPSKVKVKKGLDDVKAKIHEMLAKKAADEFKKKGGDKGGPKEIDHTEINER